MDDQTMISYAGLSSRARRCLAGMGLRTVGEVRRTPDSALLRQRTLGRRTLQHIRETLGEFIDAEAPTPNIDAQLERKLRSVAAQLVELAELMQLRQQGGAL